MAAASAPIGGARAQTSPHLLLPFHTSSLPSSSFTRSFPRRGPFRRNPHLKAFCSGFSTRYSVSWYKCRLRRLKGVVRCSESTDTELAVAEKFDRTPFDINLAVVLAGFAFEAYTNPPNDIGYREIDAADCQTAFLSEFFFRKIYDGQLLIKLQKGLDFPAMDLWGTSDPYVILQLDGQVVKGNIKWVTKEPIWNEDLTFNINKNTSKLLQVAAWDANLVGPHKRLGNAEVDLSSLCDGDSHDLVLELEGLGGGGKIHLQVTYKSFEKMGEEKQWWRMPFVFDHFIQNNLSSALKLAFGAENVNVHQFVQFAFGRINLHDILQNLQSSNEIDNDPKVFEMNRNGIADQNQHPDESVPSESLVKVENDDSLLEHKPDRAGPGSFVEDKDINSSQSYEHFWTMLASSLNQGVFQKLGISLPETFRLDGFNLLNQVSMLSQRNAEEAYIQLGLATPGWDNDCVNHDNNDGSGDSEAPSSSDGFSSLIDINKVSCDVLNQTENVLGAMMILSAAFSPKDKIVPMIPLNEQKDEISLNEDGTSISKRVTGHFISSESKLDETKTEDLKRLFSTEESAMEAWAVLATSLGQTSFIKSDFEKICFLDNDSTDTQVSIWCDSLHKRLVVAFRGTEQVKWKDMRTNLMLVPSGLNPERLGSDFKEESQVHSGFLRAYDSVKNRIMGLIKHCIQFPDNDDCESFQRWHVYITGHSLGGALATLLALELSSSRMAKCGAISVTMYNFGSPRVGNKRFAEVYNEKVRDSWRIVNHRDIIPTVPRLVGYCHVAQPIYLAEGNFRNPLENLELLEDEYQGDVIGEYTPDDIVKEVMKGEKLLIEKILQTEIKLFRSIRDGNALTQHMEDFYYITLLEKVRSRYMPVESLHA